MNAFNNRAMRKEEKTTITRNKLIEAASKLMLNSDDPQKVTSRAIAAEAGVPLGMINYCFGSREELLYEAFCQNKDEYLADGRFTSIINSDLTPKEKVRQLHYLVADFLVSEYKYTKAITGHILLNRDLTQGLNTLPLVRLHYGDTRGEWEIKLISYQLSSMMQLVIYRLKEMDDFLGMELEAKSDMHRLIDLQIDLLLVET